MRGGSVAGRRGFGDASSVRGLGFGDASSVRGLGFGGIARTCNSPSGGAPLFPAIDPMVALSERSRE